MAADWIPLERHPDDAKIMLIASLCSNPHNIPDREFRGVVFAACIRWFHYIDRHVKDASKPLHKSAFRAVTSWHDDTLCDAMCAPEVGWLNAIGDDVTIADFNEWFSKSSKKRRLASRRQSKKRSRDRHATVTHQRDKSVTTRHETRREKTKTQERSSSSETEDSELPPTADAASGNGRSKRTPNPWWNYLAERFHLDAKVHRSRLGKLASNLKTLCPDSERIAELVGVVAKQYAATYQEAAFTPEAMVKHWGDMIAKADTVEPMTLQPGRTVEFDPATCRHRGGKDRRSDGSAYCLACGATV